MRALDPEAWMEACIAFGRDEPHHERLEAAILAYLDEIENPMTPEMLAAGVAAGESHGISDADAADIYRAMRAVARGGAK